MSALGGETARARPNGRAGSGPRAHLAPAPALIVLAAVTLTAFYYFARTDTIGVYSAARGWARMTPGLFTTRLHYLAAAALLGLLPALAARRLTGLSFASLGLGLGRWREGLVWLAIGAPLAWMLAGHATTPEMRAVYPLDPALSSRPGAFWPYAGTEFLYYGAWEVLFRGVLLFGLAPELGFLGANAVQTALSVTAHFGRPLTET
ncbi:MAG: hypothetical protein ACM3JJ_04195, partial [Hyphomicrobiales bacterium]